MVSIWQYGGCMMNFINGINTLIRRVNWMNLCLWLSIMIISFTMWYWIIKLITKLIRSI